jgi:hypothetical protein
MSTKPADTHRLYGETLERIRACADLHEAKRLAAVALVTIPCREPAPAPAVKPSGAAPLPAETHLLLHRLREVCDDIGELDVPDISSAAHHTRAVVAEAIAEITRLHRLPGGALHHPERVA